MGQANIIKNQKLKTKIHFPVFPWFLATIKFFENLLEMQTIKIDVSRSERYRATVQSRQFGLKLLTRTVFSHVTKLNTR